MATSKTKKNELKTLRAQVRRLKLQLKTMLSVKVELRGNNKDLYTAIKVEQLHTYFREHGWECVGGNLRLWTNHVKMDDGEEFVYHTLDHDGYGDHANRMAEAIQAIAEWEERSPLAVLYELQNTRTNTLDKLVDGVAEDD